MLEGFFFPPFTEEMLTSLCKIISHLRGSDGVSLQTQVCYGRTATRIVCYSKQVLCLSPLARRKNPSHVVTQL